MKKTVIDTFTDKKELKEEVKEPVAEEPVGTKESFIKPIDYDAEIELCRYKVIALDEFYKEKKSSFEKEIKELQDKRDMEESVKAINNFISRLVDGGLSRDRAEDIAAEYIRKNMGLGSTEKKRVSYVDTDFKPLKSCAKLSDIADQMAALYNPIMKE